MRLRTYVPQGFGNPFRRSLLAICLAAVCTATNVAWALPGTTNLAPFGTATATGADFGASIEDAIDGNRDGNFGNGSVFYANAIPASPPLFYEVDLGVNAYIDRVQVLRRTDADQAVFGNMRLTIYQDDGAGNPGAVSFTHDYLPTTFVVGTWGTTDPGASAAGGAFGRHVRLERLDNNYWLTFAEFEVIGATSPLTFTETGNIAAGKPVTTSSPPGFGATIASGNDGNIDGSFGVPGYRPVYHSSTIAVGEYWQVDLGAATQLDHLQLFARGDHYNTTEFKVSVLDASEAPVGSFTIANAPLTDPNPGYDYVIDTAGLVGKYIRIETTKEEHLVFTELRAFAGPGSSFPVGDYNQDGVVNQIDYTTWKQFYGTNNLAADGNGDGIVDTADYVVWRDHTALGSGSSLGVAVGVPEPSAIVLALWLLPVVFRRYR